MALTPTAAFIAKKDSRTEVPILLMHMYLAGLTLYLSDQKITVGSTTYDPIVQNWGGLEKRLNYETGRSVIGDISVTMNNLLGTGAGGVGYFSDYRADNVFENRKVDIFYTFEGLGATDPLQLTSGRISSPSITTRNVMFSITDDIKDLIGQLPPRKVSLAELPYAYEWIYGEPLPIVFGSFRTLALGVNTIDHIYMVADHRVKAITDVFFVDLAGNYHKPVMSFTEQISDTSLIPGRTVATITFDEIPNHDGEVVDIVVDVQGYMDDASGTITGTPNALIENPADVIRVITDNFLGLDSTRVDYSSLADVRSARSAWKFEGPIYFEEPAIDILARMAFEMVGVLRFDNLGKLNFSLFSTVVGSTDFHFTEIDHILEDTLSLKPVGKDSFYKDFNVHYQKDWTGVSVLSKTEIRRNVPVGI